MKKLIIIGSGSGGLPVASSVVDSYKFDITVITKDSDIAYSPCGIPFVLKGDIPNYKSLIMRNKEHYDRIGIKILTETEVLEIDSKKNKLLIKDTWFDYDYLVIATGTSQRKLETKLKNVFSAHIKTLKNAEEFEKCLLIKPLKIVITGSSSIDLEFASGLKERGYDVTVVEKQKHLMPDRLDEDMSKYVEEYLKIKGIKVITGQKLIEIKGKEKIKEAVFEDITLCADILLFGADFIPETQLAKKSGFDIDEKGIKTDKTSRVFKKGVIVKNVFASGSCGQSLNIVSKPDFMYFGSTSIQRAKCVADQLLGKNTTITKSTNPRIAVLWDMNIGNVGLTSEEAKKNNIWIFRRKKYSTILSRWYSFIF